MSETKIYNFRLPIEMMERVKNATKQSSATAFVVAAVYARLDGTIDATDKLENAEGRAAETEAALVDAKGLLTAISGQLAASKARGEDLERQMALWKARAERAEQAAKVIAHSPAVVIGADPSSDKPIASIMPVTGTQFPRQLTDWQRRQLKPKVADKKGKKP